MFKISEIVQTEGWKKFMAKLYGWGAAVVLLGALFKIQHWPAASIMLILGMSTEVVIFFFSAFEPLAEELDWTLVYPELAGLEKDDEEEIDRIEHRKVQNELQAKHAAISSSTTTNTGVTMDLAGLKKLDVMLESVEVSSDLFINLGNGLNKLNQTTNNITDITDATIATQEYTTQMRRAGESVGTLADTFKSSKDDLNQSIDALTESYKATAELISTRGSEVAEKFTQSGNDLLSTYNSLSDAIKNSAEKISSESSSYGSKIEVVNKNLSALNSVYELQLQETNTHLKNTQEIFTGFQGVMTNLKDSAVATKKYNDEVNKMTDQIAELNSIYGNMLSSLNLISNSK